MQQVYSVAMTIPLTLAADNLADAQTQADLITTGSNASFGLSSALAAGLIAGESKAPRAFHSNIQLTAIYSSKTTAQLLSACRWVFCGRSECCIGVIPMQTASQQYLCGGCVTRALISNMQLNSKAACSSMSVMQPCVHIIATAQLLYGQCI